VSYLLLHNKPLYENYPHVYVPFLNRFVYPYRQLHSHDNGCPLCPLEVGIACWGTDVHARHESVPAW